MSPFEDDEYMRDLLAIAKRKDTIAKLAIENASTPVLSTALPAVLLGESRPVSEVLYEVFKAITESNYLRSQQLFQGQREAKSAGSRSVLAALAFLGVITENYDNCFAMPVSQLTVLDRDTKMEDRRDRAAHWYYPDVGNADNFRNGQEKKCLAALRQAFLDLVKDSKAVTELARGLGINLIPEPVSHEDARPQQDTQSQNAGEPASLSPVLTGLLANQPPYERRDSYHQEFAELLSRNERVIILSGPRGNGKSRLALELIAEKSPGDGDFAYIFAESTLTAVRDLKALLAARHIPTDGLGIDGLAPSFAELVCSEAAPAWVVIDNVPDDTFLKKLLPSSPETMRSRIMVTSSFDQPSHSSGIVTVAEMPAEEAWRLTCRLLPAASNEDVASLTRFFRGRPLPLVQACGFIAVTQRISVSDFLEDFLEDPLGTTDILAEDTDRALNHIYERTLAMLWAERKLNVAARVLEMVACMAPEGIPSELLWRGLRSSDVSETDRRPTKFEAAMRELQRRYLVREQDGKLSIHPLTQLLLRRLLQPKEQEVWLTLLEPLVVDLEDYSPTDILPSTIAIVLRHMLSVLAGLTHLPREHVRIGDVDRLIALGLTGFRQAGDGKSVLATVALLSSFVELDKPRNSHTMPLAYKEYARLGFATGDIRASDYIRALEEQLNPQRLTDLSWVRDVRPEEFLTYFSALVEVSAYSEALELFRIVTAMLDVEDWFYSEGSPRQHAELFTLLGVCFSNMGQWDEALASFSSAIFLARTQGGDPCWSTGHIMRSARCMLDTALMSCAHDVTSLVMNELEQIRHEWPSDVEDYLAVAHYESAWGRFLVALSVRKFAFGSGLVQDQLAEPELAMTHLKRARTFYATAGYRRLSDSVMFDLAILEIMLNEELSPSAFMPLLHDGSLFAYDRRARLQFLIVLVPFGIVFRNQYSSTGQISRYAKIAYQMADDWGSPYWYCRALEIACVTAAYHGVAYNVFLAPLYETYEQIQRLGRWESLTSALQELPGNREEFRRKYTYLLVW